MMPSTSHAHELQPEGKPHRNEEQKATNHQVVIDCQIKELYYGTFKAVRDTCHPRQEEHHHGFYRPFRMW